MSRKGRTQDRATGFRILLVDDSHDYLVGTRMLLEREGHTVLTAEDGMEALEILRKESVDLLLLDYFMPKLTGEQVVVELRKFNPHVQVILQTGYASEKPPREMLRRLDIQGYCDKSEGPEKLLLWTDVGLKAARAMQIILRSRTGLRCVLDATPDLHRIQAMSELLVRILEQLGKLLDELNETKTPTKVEGFVAILEDDEAIIRASTKHRGVPCPLHGNIDSDLHKTIARALRRGEVELLAEFTLVPLRVSELTLGVVYLENAASERDLEILRIFANQVSVAVRNVQLYELATVDRLTGAYVRRFFEQWMLRELRTAFRARAEIALLMVDVDGMKTINDTAGHLAGDQALTLIGRSLRQAIRSSEIVGRYGGDEFAIILPQTPRLGAELVAARVLSLLQDKAIDGGENLQLPLRASIGIAVLPPHGYSTQEIKKLVSPTYFTQTMHALIKAADEGLYRAKRDGGGCSREGGVLEWARSINQTAPPPSARTLAEIDSDLEK